jgi:hypothetical protein
MSEPGREGIQFDKWLLSISLRFELVDYWPQLAVLAESAENCDFCKLIRDQLKKAIPQTEFERGWLRVTPFYSFGNPYNMQRGVGLIGLSAEVVGKVKDEDEFTELVW